MRLIYKTEIAKWPSELLYYFAKIAPVRDMRIIISVKFAL